MRCKFITRGGKESLLLIFAGWGMDWRPFSSLRHDAYDIAVVWDYRDMGACEIEGGEGAGFEFAESYAEVCVLAWSLGVYAYGRLAARMPGNVTRRIAVNGTPTPVHDSCGIPQAIFDGTLDGLSDRNLQKFRLRMCGGKAGYEAFMASAPGRELDDLVGELRALGDDAKANQHDCGAPQAWDLAIIGKRDAIFPPANQLRAWQATPKAEIDEPHLPDFQNLINRHLIDKPLVRRRFAEAQTSYDGNAEVQERIASELWTSARRLLPGGMLGGSVIEVGCGTGLLTRKYRDFLDGSQWRLWDIVDQAPQGCEQWFECCDAELAIRREPSGSADCILSNCAVQWFSSPWGFIDECSRVLRPGGMLAFTTFAPENFPELGGRTLTAPSVEQWRAGLSKKFEFVDIMKCCHRLLFDTPRQALEHMKATGVNALRRGATAAEAKQILASYPLDADGKAPLTYISLSIITKKTSANG